MDRDGEKVGGAGGGGGEGGGTGIDMENKKIILKLKKLCSFYFLMKNKYLGMWRDMHCMYMHVYV